MLNNLELAPLNGESPRRASSNHLQIQPTSDRSILVVEDDHELADAMTIQLEHYGYDPKVASCIRDAKQLIKTDKPDLIILDLNLPDGSGLTMLNDLNQDNKIHDVPVVIVTAYGFMHKMAWSFPNTVAFFEKPIMIHQLLEPIREVLE